MAAGSFSNGTIVDRKPATPAAMRELRQTLNAARDEQIVRVVSLVDALPHRGAADTLLIPLRPRLMLLRPPRKFSFPRLLFTPFDAIILDAAKWRRGSMGIPRTALVPLANQVRLALGEHASSFERDVAGNPRANSLELLDRGQALWVASGDVLEGASMPAEWTATTGLSEVDHATLCLTIALVLRQAPRAEIIIHDVGRGLPPDMLAVKSVLADLTTAGLCHGPAVAAHAVGMMLAVLLSRLPDVSALITAVTDLGSRHVSPTARQAEDQAIDFLLDEMEATTAVTGDLRRAAETIGRMSGLLDALQDPGPGQRPSRRARIERLRHQIDLACRARFAQDLSSQILQPALTFGTDATDLELATLENATRALRQFDCVSRELAGGQHYDTMLRHAADAMATAVDTAIPQVDRARLVEILAGPDRALAMLAGGDGRAGVQTSLA